MFEGEEFGQEGYYLQCFLQGWSSKSLAARGFVSNLASLRTGKPAGEWVWQAISFIDLGLPKPTCPPI